MWLKAFESDNKLLSESELWLLTLVRDKYEGPTVIMDRLYEQTGDWTPKPGTVYPILHRLADTGLLEKSELHGLSFRRSEKARVFLSSIAKPLRVQLMETWNYYRVILQNLYELEKIPFRFPEILGELGEKSKDFTIYLKKMEQETQKRQISEENSFDVSITFED